MRKRREEGYTLVVIASMITVFLGFVALSIDVGTLSSARASAQRAADAAALAGAFVFITRGDLNETTTPKQSDVIKENAIKAAGVNKMLGANVSVATGDVTVDVANHRVTVQVTQDQPTLFARILGQNTASIRATAIAEAASAANATGCLKPFFIPNTALFAGGGATTQCDACTSTPKQVLIEKVGSDYQVTAWAKTQIQTGNNEFLLKPQDPKNALRPGDFMLIDIPGHTPGELGDNIAVCMAESSACLQTYSVLTGDHAGPVKNAIKTLINCPNPDVYLGPGRYQRQDGTVGSTSNALVVCPIWDVCNATIDGTTPFCPTAKVPGGTNFQLPIVGFAVVFVEGLTSGKSGTIDCTGNDAIARLINVSACGGSGGGPFNPGETGPFGVPLRLVRAP